MFNGCTALKTVNLPEKSKMADGGSNALFRNCKAMTSFQLPSGFTNMNNYMFAGCSGLSSVILPSTLTRIGQNAFEDCTGLQSMNAPDNVSIQEGSLINIWNKGAFQGCKGLVSVTISGNTNITKNTFRDCFALRNVSILGNTATVGELAFVNCKALGSITLPASVTTVGVNAFSGCASLSSVVMNDAVTLGNTAFTGCNMTELTLRAGSSAGNTVTNYFSTGKTWTLPGSSQPIKRLILTGTGITATVNAVKGCAPANGSILADGSSIWVYQAVWALKGSSRQTVTFNPDYAPSNNTILLTDTSGRLPYVPVSSRRGYVFNGWSNDNYPTVTASTVFTSDTTLTAKWTPETYRLTLDKNDMTGASDAVAISYGSDAISGTFPSYTRTGYTFGGFQAGGANGVNIIDTGGILLSNVGGYTDSSKNWIEPGGVTLFAKWNAQNNGKYTVKYMCGNDVVKSTEMTGKTYGKIYSETSGTVTGYNVPTQTKSIVLDGDNPSIVFACTANTYTVTLGPNGGTSTASASVQYGALSATVTGSHSKTGYTLTGYYVDTGSGAKVMGADGTLVSDNTTYTQNGKWNYDGNATLHARWTANTYSIAITSDGAASGRTATATYDSSTVSFAGELTKTGYHLTGYYKDSVKIIGTNGTLESDTGYVTGGKWSKDPCTGLVLSAGWEINTYTITATAGANGAIDPSGSVSVNHGATQIFTFIPVAGYQVDQVKVDNVVTSTTGNQYTFNNVTCDKTINVTFKRITYTITASAGTNGSINPSGTTVVNHGANQTFTFTPSTGYQVDTVKVDGTAQSPAPDSHTFTDVTAPHTIDVTFKNIKYSVTYSPGTHGTFTSVTTDNLNYGNTTPAAPTVTGNP